MLHFALVPVAVLIAVGPFWSNCCCAELPQDAATHVMFDDTAIEFFEREVRPLLVRRCYECHSADAKRLQGGLRLDSRADILQGGDSGPAIQPGKPDESLLIDAINYGELFEMPPKSKLPAEEIAVLAKWVEMGAPWQEETTVSAMKSADTFDLHARRDSHWCWKPIRGHEAPPVQNTNWPRQSMDHFILRRLEEAQLAPSAQVDRETLLRRAYFDIIGLPPTTQQVESFLNDTSSEAFEKVVDDLLRSPHFGERWARHWMDLVRYAESYGHEFDYDIPYATAYRDYLIRAFNADVPYDQFLTEQIAGDLLSQPRRHAIDGYNESVIGTGFWQLGEATHAPVDVLGDEAGRLDNQIDVFGKTFLGVTIACARCHDHKFDAISTQDYYALAGMLKSSRRQEAILDPHGQIESVSAELKALSAEADRALRAALDDSGLREPSVMGNYLRAARAVMHENADPAKVAVEGSLDKGTLMRWVAALADKDCRQPGHPLRIWAELAAGERPVSPAELERWKTRLHDERSRAEKSRTQSTLLADFDGGNYAGWFTTGHAFGSAPTRAAQWDAGQGQVAFIAPGVAHSGTLSPRLQGVLRSPTFTIRNRNILYRIAGKNAQVRLIVDGYFMDVFNGLLFRGFSFNVDDTESFRWHTQSQDVERYLGHRAHIEIIDHGDGFVAVDEIRFSDKGPPPEGPHAIGLDVLANEDVDSLDSLALAYDLRWQQAVSRWQRGEASRGEVEFIQWAVNHRLFPIDPARVRYVEEISSAYADKSANLPSAVRVLATTDGTGENSKIYIRGNHHMVGDDAQRGNLTALGQFPRLAAHHGSGRLELARRLTDPANPLTSRVIVNRIWHHLFGRGIVATTDNFGVLGQPPTHPQLLDHLAAEFMEHGWSMKRLIRTMLLSSTYQMSSAPTARGDMIDPQNQLLHRMRIRRLQGEAIRDAILRVSGRLDTKLFGPSVPVHLTEFMQGRGRPRGSGPVDGHGRRSIYTSVRRNFLPPMMLAFDTPIPFSTVGQRNVSNVPSQALTLMNDPFVVQQARVWAEHVLADKQASSEERVQRMYHAAFARPPSPLELHEAISFLSDQARALGVDVSAARQDPRVWADLCHVLFNVKEFIYVN